MSQLTVIPGNVATIVVMSGLSIIKMEPVNTQLEFDETFKKISEFVTGELFVKTWTSSVSVWLNHLAPERGRGRLHQKRLLVVSSNGKEYYDEMISDNYQEPVFQK